MKKWKVTRKQGKKTFIYGVTAKTRKDAEEITKPKGGTLISVEPLKTED